MRLAVILIFVSVVCGLVYFVFSHPGLEQLERLERELRSLEAQNEELAARNEDLEHQILALRDDPRLAERRARESSGLARPNELIFQFEEPDEAVAVRVRLEVGAERLELAGETVALEALDDELEALQQRMPQAVLEIHVDDEVTPIERQRVVDIVEESPMGPGIWTEG